MGARSAADVEQACQTSTKTSMASSCRGHGSEAVSGGLLEGGRGWTRLWTSGHGEHELSAGDGPSSIPTILCRCIADGRSAIELHASAAKVPTGSVALQDAIARHWRGRPPIAWRHVRLAHGDLRGDSDAFASEPRLSSGIDEPCIMTIGCTVSCVSTTRGFGVSSPSSDPASAPCRHETPREKDAQLLGSPWHAHVRSTSEFIFAASRPRSNYMVEAQQQQ